MNIQLLSLVVGCTLIATHIILVSCFLKRVIPNNFIPMMAHVISASSMLLIMTGLYAAGMAFNPWLVFSILSFGIIAYLFLFGAIYKSLSLRLLIFTWKKGGNAPLAMLNQDITTQTFTERAKLLCSMGLVTTVNQEYQLTTRGALIANRILRVRKIFRIKTTGLY